jgi:hypothetical protein
MGLFGAPKLDDKAYFAKFLEGNRYGPLYMNCINTCIEDFGQDLNTEEKVCLAKCIDITNGYLDMYSNEFVSHLTGRK